MIGPVFEAIDHVLQQDSDYPLFRQCRLTPLQFHALVDRRAKALIEAGLPGNDLPFVKRMPPNVFVFAIQAMQKLAERGLVPRIDWDEASFRRTATAAATFQHDGLMTYIYPEEGLILWALARACPPRRALFLGSYYGYWASWILPVLASAGGRATLVDPDPRSCDVARRNIEALGLGAHVDIILERGEPFLARRGGEFDFVVLDAENPRDHPDPRQRGKRVYQSLLEAALPCLGRRSLLVCHNILFQDETGDPAFDAIIARNEDELGHFRALAREHFEFVEIASTEGVGVGRLRDPSAPRDGSTIARAAFG